MMEYTCMTEVLMAPRRNLNNEKHNRKKWNN